MKGNNKKGQIQIQEMAFVLVAIILLFGLILLGFAMFQSTKIKQLAYETRKEKTIAMLDSIANMPEFSCKNAYCLDEEKLIAYLNLEDRRTVYDKFWKNLNIALIKVERIVPEKQGNCNEQNYPNCKTYVLYVSNKDYQAYSTFMPLCYYSTNYGKRCDIAKLTVGFEIPKVK